MDTIDHFFDRLRNVYERLLRSALQTLPVIIVFAAIVLVSLGFLFTSAKKELAPTEDQGFIGNLATAAPDATLEQKQIYARQIFDKLSAYQEDYIVFQIVTPGPFVTGMVMKPWNQRKRTTMEL